MPKQPGNISAAPTAHVSLTDTIKDLLKDGVAPDAEKIRDALKKLGGKVPKLNSIKAVLENVTINKAKNGQNRPHEKSSATDVERKLGPYKRILLDIDIDITAIRGFAHRLSDSEQTQKLMGQVTFHQNIAKETFRNLESLLRLTDPDKIEGMQEVIEKLKVKLDDQKIIIHGVIEQFEEALGDEQLEKRENLINPSADDYIATQEPAEPISLEEMGELLEKVSKNNGGTELPRVLKSQDESLAHVDDYIQRRLPDEKTPAEVADRLNEFEKRGAFDQDYIVRRNIQKGGTYADKDKLIEDAQNNPTNPLLQKKAIEILLEKLNDSKLKKEVILRLDEIYQKMMAAKADHDYTEIENQQAELNSLMEKVLAESTKIPLLTESITEDRRFEDILKKTEELQEDKRKNKYQKWLERGKKFAESSYNIINNFGNKYNEVGLSYKLALSGALITASLVGSPLLSGTILVAAITGQRVTGLLGAFVAYQVLISNQLTKIKESPNSKEQKIKSFLRKNPKTSAAILAAILAGATVTSSVYAGQVIAESFEKFGALVSDGSKEAAQSFVHGKIESIHIEQANNVMAVESTTAPEKLSEYSVEKGDNMYKILRANFDQISNLEGGRQTNAIENILAKIKEDPAAYGIKSGDVNKLSIGDSVDLEKISQILETEKIGDQTIIERASNLPEKDVARIESYTPPTLNSSESFFAIPNDHINNGQIIEVPSPAEYSDNIPRSEIATINNVETNTPISSQQLATRAQELVRLRLDEMFGSSGFLGIFGGHSGIDSASWRELSPVSASEIIATDLNNIPEEVSSKRDFKVFHNYLHDLALKTETIPSATESAGAFIQRATENLIKKDVTLTT